MPPSSHLPLFGGYRAWNPTEWTPSDDRIRGGSSTSTLTCSPASLTARFRGTLDTATLGGAGFASQRTTTSTRVWDLSSYDGIELVIDNADGKVYTLTLKDEILPRRPDGRERSSISWEVDFGPGEGVGVGNGRRTVFVKWSDFRATYHGREVNAEPLDLRNVRRFGIMVRSFFGEQSGAFELGIVSIAALRTERYLDHLEDGEEGEDDYVYLDEKDDGFRQERGSRGLFGWLSACLGF